MLGILALTMAARCNTVNTNAPKALPSNIDIIAGGIAMAAFAHVTESIVAIVSVQGALSYGP